MQVLEIIGYLFDIAACTEQYGIEVHFLGLGISSGLGNNVSCWCECFRICIIYNECNIL